MLVSPSLLSADFGNLDREIEMLNKSNADMIHPVSYTHLTLPTN